MRLNYVQPPISFVSIRGSNTASFRAHSCSFVVQKHRLLFVPFGVFRGPIPPTTAPCVSSVKIRVHPWREKHRSSGSSVAQNLMSSRRSHSCSFVVQKPPPFVPIRVHSWFKNTPPANISSNASDATAPTTAKTTTPAHHSPVPPAPTAAVALPKPQSTTNPYPDFAAPKY